MLHITADPLFLSAGRHYIEAVEQALPSSALDPTAPVASAEWGQEAVEAWRAAAGLATLVAQRQQDVLALDQRYDEFHARWQEVKDSPKANGFLAQALRAFAPAAVSPRQARRAAQRYGDASAVYENYLTRRNRIEGEIRAALLAIGGELETAAAAVAPAAQAHLARMVTDWLCGGLAALLLTEYYPHGHWQVPRAGLLALAQVLAILQSAYAGDSRLRAITDRLAELVQSDDVYCWVQLAAAQALFALHPDRGVAVARQRLRPGPDDRQADFLTRAELVSQLTAHIAYAPVRELLASITVADEPSETVLQEALQCAAKYRLWPTRDALGRLLADARPLVRAYALQLGLEQLHEQPDQKLYDMVMRRMDDETDSMPLRLLAEQALLKAVAGSRSMGPERAALERIARRTFSTRQLNNRCLRALNAIDVLRNDSAYQLWQVLRADITSWPEGQRARLPLDRFPCDAMLLGRVLTVIVEDDFGYEFAVGGRRIILKKGDFYRPILWRLLHEIRTPSPEKRQAYPHHVGRDPRLPFRVPPVNLAEQTATKVPGERLFIEYEGDWRPHLPLLDDCLALLLPGRLRSATIFSYRGTTRIEAPQLGQTRLLQLYFRLSKHFADLARIRNANPLDREYSDVGEFVRILRREFGFTLTFTPLRPEAGAAWAEEEARP